MLRVRTHLLPMLALLAVACSQVFGVQRGYICERNGWGIETMADHHHSGDGLSVEDFDHGTTDHHHEEGDDNTEHHAPLKVDMSASHVPSATSVQAVMMWATDQLAALMVPAASELKRLGSAPPYPGERAPPAALVVAESVVFLV